MRIWILFCFLLAWGRTGAQQRAAIEGNGRLKTEIRSLDAFHSVDIQFLADVRIHCGAMPMAKIRLDESLLPYLSLRVEEGVLTIRASEWIETCQAEIELGTAFLHSLKCGAWGRVSVSGIDTRSFRLEAPVGWVELSGRTESLAIRAGGGKVDASRLSARDVEIVQEGWGSSQVLATGSLRAQVARGRVEVIGNPAQVETRVGEMGVLEGLGRDKAPASEGLDSGKSFRILNNRAKKGTFVVVGPPGQRFSYGFPLGPFASRGESWPAGTKVFEETPLGTRGRLLLTVGSDAQGKTLSLYP
jgi:hypothetical protein